MLDLNSWGCLPWVEPERVNQWSPSWQGKLMLIMPHLAFGWLRRVSSQEDPQWPLHLIGHMPGFAWTFHPSHFSPKVNSVTGRKKAPLDWRSRGLDVKPGPVLPYPWQGGNQNYLTMEAAQPIKCCRIPGCRCGPTEGDRLPPCPGWGWSVAFMAQFNATCSEFLYKRTVTYLKRSASKLLKNIQKILIEH